MDISVCALTSGQFPPLSPTARLTSFRVVRMAYSAVIVTLSLFAQELGRDFLCCDDDTLCQILCGVCACMPLSLLLLWLPRMPLLTLYSASSGVDSHSYFTLHCAV